MQVADVPGVVMPVSSSTRGRQLAGADAGRLGRGGQDADRPGQPDRAAGRLLPHRRPARSARPPSASRSTATTSILDDIWAWRADHGNGVGWTSTRPTPASIVNGDDVTATGLFVEHYQKYNVIWNGERGRTIFFQNELPYDPPNQAAWQHDGVLGWAAYKVATWVTTHEGWGLGSYCFFTRPLLLRLDGGAAPAGARALHRPAHRAPARHVRPRRALHREVADGDALPRRGPPRTRRSGSSSRRWRGTSPELRERVAKVNAEWRAV